MSFSLIRNLLFQSLLHTLIVSAPILLTGTIVGLIMGIFQTTTSIQEQSLSFVPKIIAIFIAMAFFGSFMIGDLVNFTSNLFLLIPKVAK